MSSELHIRLADAGKRYNRDWIFKNLSFELVPGSRLSLTGSNGSGKSTLLQVMAGYQSLSSGSRTYLVNGAQLSEDQLYKQLSIATPYLDLPEAYSLEELLSFHFSLKPKKTAFDMNSWIESAGLQPHLTKKLQYFSSGMKQRVKLLLALGADVPLLMLDEPTTNLDEQGIQWYQAMIGTLATRQSIVVASNQPHEYAFCTQNIEVTAYKKA
ncbi:MAG: ATP-binding cassette domain-containing protein [Sphingobacteriaceae bacterium]|nr:ATP-binding cassette domain-containing protein [Sphingobacteriaceae bacterium]